MSDLPDAPRLDWDRWATGVLLDSGKVYEQDLTEDEMATLNDETSSGVDSDGGWLAILLPVAFDLEASFLAIGGEGNAFAPQWSADTTSGEDGTWEDFPEYDAEDADAGGDDAEKVYQTDWRTINLTGVKGVRWGGDSTLSRRRSPIMMHLYGYPADEPDGLVLWQADSDEPLPRFDFGDVLRGGTPQAAFRLRNRGDDTAEGVKVKGETVTSRYDTIADAVEFSDDDGGTWVSELLLGDLSGDTTSDSLLVRVNLPDDARLGRFAVRVVPERDDS